jgi:hypothetical protein
MLMQASLLHSQPRLQLLPPGHSHLSNLSAHTADVLPHLHVLDSSNSLQPLATEAGLPVSTELALTAQLQAPVAPLQTDSQGALLPGSGPTVSSSRLNAHSTLPQTATAAQLGTKAPEKASGVQTPPATAAAWAARPPIKGCF